MKLVTPKQIQEVDRQAIEDKKIPGILLMEHAAWSIYDYLKAKGGDERVVIVCGPGNNGGDGLALARLLTIFSTREVVVWLVASPDKLSRDGKIYYEICKQLKVPLFNIKEENKEAKLEELTRKDIVVDALFGTGLSRPIMGIYKEIIEGINQVAPWVISVDIPSGIEGETGKVQGICIQATVTFTFTAPKIGLFLYPAILYTGEVRVEKIGIPEELVDKIPSQIFSIEKKEMAALLPIRPIRSHKGTFGKVLTIGGSMGMSGAISLTSLAAYKVGCGTVTAAVPRSIISIVQQKLTEVMALSLEDEEGYVSCQASLTLKEKLSPYQVIAIGPGMGRHTGTLELLKVVLATSLPCVIDADALSFIGTVKMLIKQRQAPIILTPHAGEMARIMEVPISCIIEEPLFYAQKLAKELRAIVVLKIEKTVIVDWADNIYINRCGNSGLAKGGSGDTLTGIIAGLLAQHLTPIDAARLGVYLQTRAADIAKAKCSEYSYLASDTINYLGEVFKELKDV